MIRLVFNYVTKIIRVCLCFVLSVCHSLSRACALEVKPNLSYFLPLITTLRVFVVNCDWFIVLSASVVIGQYFPGLLPLGTELICIILKIYFNGSSIIIGYLKK